MVSLLALASKPLYDREMLELRSENESLKLKLFWKDYNVHKLHKAMQSGNSFPADAPYCQCQTCVHFKRSVRPRKKGPLHGGASGGSAPLYDAVCKFGPWFASAARRFGLTVKKASWGMHYDSTQLMEHDSNPELEVLDLDCHLVNTDGHEWTHFTSGRRLWGATTADSPELKKLSEFFRYLQRYCLVGDEEFVGRKRRGWP